MTEERKIIKAEINYEIPEWMKIAFIISFGMSFLIMLTLWM